MSEFSESFHLRTTNKEDQWLSGQDIENHQEEMLQNPGAELVE